MSEVRQVPAMAPPLALLASVERGDFRDLYTDSGDDLQSAIANLLMSSLEVRVAALQAAFGVEQARRDPFYDDQADVLLAMFPEEPEESEEPQPGPHEHQWFIGCRKDMHGTTVLDCACGARKRTRGGVDGGEVIIEAPANAMGDVLIDASQIATP